MPMSTITEQPQAPERNQLMAGRQRAAWLFLTPMLIVLALVAAYPLFLTIWYSFTDASLVHLKDAQWIGFKNYFRSFTTDSGKTVYGGVLMDKAWWGAVWNTVRFGAVSVFLETVLGLAVALVLNANFKGRGLVRAAILIPWAIPTVVSAKLWGWMLNDQLGIINRLFMDLGLIHQKIAWAADADYSMIAVVAVDTWKTLPFMALLILAGLQQVPGDVYEAASIDGVHPVKVFWKVTLPLIRPALMVAVIFRLLDALRIFDLVYILTPNSSQTKTMSVIARENLFDFDKFAYGSAESTILFLFLLILVTLYVKLGRVNLAGGN
ncbi:sugar ABC transporter permease [Aestuariivirga litoralis]|nr:sugar ABC transporter permease [Aestuariivirga litoralis]MBG1232555.1 sugar ABC transporter permease [Aestuariivirga litoralis]